MGKAKSSYLKKFNRLLVWLTLILFVIFAVSGYGIINPELTSQLTGGIFLRSVSLYLHLNLAFPILTLITLHVLIGVRSALTRWGVKEGRLLDSFLIILGIFSISLLALMQYFIL
jgi:cytochrome b subunit of formate dehydrogenase